MANYGYTQYEVMLDGSSANSSVRTSNPLWVGDAWPATMFASYATAAAVASVVSIHASLDEGFQTALSSGAAGAPGWVLWGSMTGSAYSIVAVSTGPRWIRFVRSAADSQASIVVEFRVS